MQAKELWTSRATKQMPSTLTEEQQPCLMIKIHCGNYTDRRIHLWCVLRETIVTIILQMQPLYNPQRSTYPDPPKICHATTASNDNISHSKRTKDLHKAPNNRKKNLTYSLSTKKVQTNKPEQVNELVISDQHQRIIWYFNLKRTRTETLKLWAEIYSIYCTLECISIPK